MTLTRACSFFGLRRFAMRLWLDPQRLEMQRLTALDVVKALQSQNVQVAGGSPPTAGSQREHDWNESRKMAAPLEAALSRAVDALAGVRRKPAAERKRNERAAALRARKEASEALRALRRRHQLEIDHLEPRWDGGYKFGCWNQVSNFCTLRHADHVLATNRQMRRIKPGLPSTERTPSLT